MCTHFGARAAWVENGGGDATTWTLHILATNKNKLHSIFAYDFDNDGDLDVFAGESEGMAWIWENTDGKGTFKEHAVAMNARGHDARVGDVDCDGDLDIAGKPWGEGEPEPRDAHLPAEHDRRARRQGRLPASEGRGLARRTEGRSTARSKRSRALWGGMTPRAVARRLRSCSPPPRRARATRTSSARSVRRSAQTRACPIRAAARARRRTATLVVGLGSSGTSAPRVRLAPARERRVAPALRLRGERATASAWPTDGAEALAKGPGAPTPGLGAPFTDATRAVGVARDAPAYVASDARSAPSGRTTSRSRSCCARRPGATLLASARARPAGALHEHDGDARAELDLGDGTQPRGDDRVGAAHVGRLVSLPRLGEPRRGRARRL